jgi:hypothetical protein
MAKFGGEFQYIEDDGTVITGGTRKCWHCQKPVHFRRAKEIMDKMEFCRVCAGLICLDCLPEYQERGCRDHRRQIEQVEEAFYRSQQFAKSMGF